MPKVIKSIFVSTLILITFLIQPSFAFLGSPQSITSVLPLTYNLRYTYDSNSNRTKLTYPDSSYITYIYDELNRLTSIKDSSGTNIASYTYDPLSRRTQLDYVNNTQTLYTYDAINRLTSINQGLSPQGTVPEFSYTYDNVGNRKSMTDLSGTHNYTYDTIYQLKSADYPLGYTFPDISFSYDSVGNRISTLNGGTTNYTTNNLNQYTQVGTTNYTYDANGNLTSDGTWTYAYDYENRLITASKTGTSATYKYDPFGRRIEKTVDTTTTNFLYDGDQLIAEYDNLGNLITKYIYGSGIDEPIRLEKGGTSYYYHYDGLGSVTSLTSTTGSTSESYTYDAFGKPTTTSTLGNRYMFTGREYDSETNLYYYRARYYNPTVGRFLQKDPIGYFAEMNLYTYCGNNSINWIDPFGLDKEDGNKGVFSKGHMYDPDGRSIQATGPEDPALKLLEPEKEFRSIEPAPEDPTPKEPNSKKPKINISLDVTSVVAGFISFIPTPVTAIGGYVVSLGASVAGLFYTEKQYREGEATKVDVIVSRITTAISAIPYVGIIGSGAQLIYDLIRQRKGP